MNRSSSALFLALGLIVGCAHAPSGTPVPSPAAMPSGSARASAPNPSSAPPQSQAPGAGAAPSSGPIRLDPREEITSRELASIPDPVPGTSEAARTQGTNDRPAPGAAAASGTASPATSGARSNAEAMSSAPPATSDTPATPGATDRAVPSGKRSVWRVQIYASPMLQEADRVAKDASAKLGATYVLEFEGTLYKVRLGAFDTEDAALDLRERAIRLGYAGAFRMREDAENPAKE